MSALLDEVDQELESRRKVLHEQVKNKRNDERETMLFAFFYLFFFLVDAILFFCSNPFLFLFQYNFLWWCNKNDFFHFRTSALWLMEM